MFCSPPNGILVMMNTLAQKRHKSMHNQQTDEAMVGAHAARSKRRFADRFLGQLPLFIQDTDGTPSKGKFIMGKRNWCSIRWDQKTGGLLFDIRVERQKGVGETVRYACFLILPWIALSQLIWRLITVISSMYLHPVGTVKTVRSSEKPGEHGRVQPIADDALLMHVAHQETRFRSVVCQCLCRLCRNV